MSECKPLVVGSDLCYNTAENIAALCRAVAGRDLYSSTFQLSLSRFCHWLSDTDQRVSQKVLTLS